MLRVTKTAPHDLEPNDIGFLLKSVEQAGEDWNFVAGKIASGEAVVWILEGEKTRGIVLTTISGDLLFIWHVGGIGLWRVYKSILRAFQDIAKKAGLHGIQGQSVPVIAKLLSRHGFTTPRSVVEWRT